MRSNALTRAGAASPHPRLPKPRPSKTESEGGAAVSRYTEEFTTRNGPVPGGVVLLRVRVRTLQCA